MKLLTVRNIIYKFVYRKFIEIVSFLCSGQVPNNFHRIIENHDLDRAYKELSEYIVSELEAQRNEGVTVNLTRIPIESK